MNVYTCIDTHTRVWVVCTAGQGVHIENFSELHLRCTGEDFNFVQVERALKAIAANS